MNDAVEKYLEKKKKQQLKEKKKFLISQGLIEKKYSPENKCNTEYSEIEWDNEKKINRYYKIDALDVTDEEYNEILHAHAETGKPPFEATKNGISTMLTVIACLIYFGGLFFGFAFEEFLGVLICWISSFISGSIMLGFSQIIKLLHSINEKFDYYL